MCLFEEEEAEGGDHGYYGSQSHALELYRAYDDGCAGEAGDIVFADDVFAFLL